MILTCPACSTKYSVDDASLGAKGRSVRCAACGHSWHATAQTSTTVIAPPTPAQPAPVAVDEPDWGDAFAQVASASAEPVIEASPEPVRVSAHTEFRARRIEKKRKTKLALVGGAWGITAAAVVASLVVVFLLRAEVVRLWPKSASAFALVGAPVNPFGLEFEQVKLDRQVIDGAPVLSITGAVRNTTTRKQSARPIELSLMDHKNHVVYSWTVQPEQSHLKPGELAKFMTRIANAPVEAMQIDVTLLASAKDAKASGDQIALKRKGRGASTDHAPGAGPMAGAMMAGEGMAMPTSEGEPFAGHGEAEVPFDPLGADAPLSNAVADAPHDGPVAAPHG